MSALPSAWKMPASSFGQYFSLHGVRSPGPFCPVPGRNQAACRALGRIFHSLLYDCYKILKTGSQFCKNIRNTSCASLFCLHIRCFRRPQTGLWSLNPMFFRHTVRLFSDCVCPAHGERERSVHKNVKKYFYLSIYVRISDTCCF